MDWGTRTSKMTPFRPLFGTAVIGTAIFVGIYSDFVRTHSQADEKNASSKPAVAESTPKSSPAAKPAAGKPDALPSASQPTAAPTRIASRAEETRTAASAHPLLPVLELARISQKETAALKDYRGLFTKKERIKNRLDQQTMEFKCRHEPFGVYFKFLDPSAGREVIYVTGQNKGHLLIHEAGFRSIVGTLSLAPNDPNVMAENRHPINQSGMKNMLDLVIAQWEAELKYSDAKVTIQDSKLGEADCHYIEVSHPVEQPHFPFAKTCLYIEKERKLPIRLEQWGFATKKSKSPLMEEYNYFKIETNVGLTDLDFDRANKAYKF